MARRGSITLADYPKLAREWHPKKNGILQASDVAHRSDKKVWWKCNKAGDHEWMAPASARSAGVGCPYCSNRRISKQNSLARQHPSLARQWHQTRNGKLTPRDVVPGSRRRVWWKCPKSRTHIWQAYVYDRTTQLRRHGKAICPFCERHNKSLSVVAPPLARQLHPTKNGNLRAAEIAARSHGKVWWRCSKVRTHVWQTAVSWRVAAWNQGKGECPYCDNDRVSDTNSLAALHPELAAEWHPTKNRLKPTQIVPGSDQMCWWRCPKGPDHEWEARCYSRARDGKGCPFCRGKRVSVTNCLANRFPKVAAWWDPTRNGTLTPDGIVSGSSRECWWRCPFGHVWRARVGNLTKSGACPHCKPRRRRVATKRKPKGWVHLPSYDGPRYK